MLKISKSSKSQDNIQRHCTPNILPCRIHHDGPVDASPRYWAPELTKSGKPEVYFRGRKLIGQEIDVPQGYRGVIVKETENENIALQNTDKGDLGDEEQERITLLNEVGSFEKLIVWNHERMVDGDDPFMKGLEEWIGFAEAMHAPGEV